MKTELHSTTKEVINNGEIISVKGTVYKEPVAKTEENKFYTAIVFTNSDGIQVYEPRLFVEQLSKDDLEKNVEYFANMMLVDLKSAN